MKNREKWRLIIQEAKAHSELYRRGEGRNIYDGNVPVWVFPRGTAQKKLYKNGKRKQICKIAMFR
jgi:hypothetical protein